MNAAARILGVSTLPIGVPALVALLSIGAPFVASAATYYVSPISTDCASAAGSGTISDPWQNLNRAIRSHTFAPGDIILLRGGTYQNSYSGFTAGCNAEGASNGVNSVLPLPLTGTSNSPIVIQNYPGETVVVDGTNARLTGLTWSACGTNSWTANLNVGSASTGQVWVNPSGPSDPGTRLQWAGTGGCSGLAPGQFSISGGGTVFSLRMPDSSNVNNATVKMSCQNGDCAYSPVSAIASTDQYVTVRLNASGGGFYVKYGYYSLWIDGGANHITLDGVQFIAAGGRDYGSCVRIYNGSFNTVKNGRCQESMGEGLEAYGGGPGTGTPGIQISNNTFQNMDVLNTGNGFIDGGGNGNNLGMGVIIKNCNNCALTQSRVRNSIADGVEVTTSVDSSSTLTSHNVIVDGNEFYDCGHLYQGQNRTSSCIHVEPQSNGPGGGSALQNTLIANNVIHNETFVARQGETPSGIVIANGGSVSPVGVVIANNSMRFLQDVCVNVQGTSVGVTFRNNAMSLCAQAGNRGSGVPQNVAWFDDNQTTHTHSNNTYWSANATDFVVAKGYVGTTTRATVAVTYEPSAVVSDPLFGSATNLRPQAGSALIDGGTNTNCPAFDASGASRPLGTRCDVGAFEFNGGGQPSAPSAPANVRIIGG